MLFTVLGLVGVIAATLGGRQGAAPAGRDIAVCIHDQVVVPPAVLYQAQGLAARTLSTAGVKVDWRCNGSAAWRFFTVEFASRAPERFKSAALGYALAFGGSRSTIFLDRLQQAGGDALLPKRLGYVLVHEIAHLIYGNDGHSDGGIMKAHWTSSDYRKMQAETLSFTEGDLAEFRVALRQK
jgi:hypothetical protein